MRLFRKGETLSKNLDNNLGALSSYKHVIILYDIDAVYFYEPNQEGAFASGLIPQASIYIWNTYVSILKLY